MLNLRPDIKQYPVWPKDDLKIRLATLTAELSSIIEDYYRMKADEVRGQAEAFLSSREETIAGRERDVRLAIYHTTASILETRAQIESLKEEKDLILILLGVKNDATF